MKKIYLFLFGILTISLTTKSQPGPGICMVTVDDSSKHNVIYYDKTQFSVVDSVILWRESNTTPGTYSRVMANPIAALSQFLDMDTAGDPNIKLHRYKLQAYDQIGGYTQLGPYHTALYCLQNVTNYAWNLYDVEGVGSGMVTKYMLLRDDNSLNAWHAIDSTTNTATAATDPAVLSFPNGQWRLVTKWSLSCTPTSRYGNNEVQTAVVKSKSNITNNRTAGLSGLKSSQVILYPNPTTDKVVLRLNFPQAQNTIVKIYNSLGAEVMQTMLPAGKDEMEINLSNFSKGIYVVEFTNNNYKMCKRLAVE